MKQKPIVQSVSLFLAVLVADRPRCILAVYLDPMSQIMPHGELLVLHTSSGTLYPLWKNIVRRKTGNVTMASNAGLKAAQLILTISISSRD